MILSKKLILEYELINNGKDENYRAAGYDVTVKEIFIPRSTSMFQFNKIELASKLYPSRIVEEYSIPPQGMCMIFSEEKIELPVNIIGFATPKTSLSEQGLMVLNTGLIDPGYEGYVSVVALNFSSREIVLKKGDSFLRTIFMFIDSYSNELDCLQNKNSSDYDIYKKDKIFKYKDLPSSFLDIEKWIEKLSSVSTKKIMRSAIIILAVSTLVFGLLQTVSSWLLK